MPTRFIATAELGRLAKWLRIFGFDTAVEKNKALLIIRSLREDRLIVTRASRMPRFAKIRAIKIDSDIVEEQLKQLIKKLDLKIDRDNLFSRCILCNTVLELAEKDSIEDEVPSTIFEMQKDFMKCPACGKIYWRGTHWMLVNKFLDGLK